MASEFTDSGLSIDGGEAQPIWSAELHYFQHDPEDWPMLLGKLRDLGLTHVSSVVPWAAHERRAGKLDFESPNLRRFVEQVDKAGLSLLLSIGPAAGAELTHFGIPRHILDDKAALAVTARNTPAWLPSPPHMFPIPSYASAAFIGPAQAWLAAVSGALREFACPAGPLVAVGLDQHLPMFYRLGAFDLDYHADSLAWWSEYAGDRPAPRRFDPDQPGDSTRWVAFKDHYAERALSWIAHAVRDGGLGEVAMFHVGAPTDVGLCGGPALARAGSIAIAADNHDIGDTAARLETAATSSTYPWLGRMHLGGPPWLPPPDDERQHAAAARALSCGFRGANLYMGVERDRWTGGAVTETGEALPLGRQTSALVNSLADADWNQLRRTPPVAVVHSRVDDRFAVASSAIDPITPVGAGLLDLGAGGFRQLALDREAETTARYVAAVCEELERADVPYHRLHEDAAAERFMDYRLLVLPTGRRIDAAAWDKLEQAKSAGATVVLGPGRPTHDAFDEPLANVPTGVGWLRDDCLQDRDGLAGDLADAAGQLGEHWIAPDSAAVHCRVFCSEDGEARVVFVVNRGPQTLATVFVPPRTELCCAIDGERFQADNDGAVEVPLASRATRVFLTAVNSG